MHKSFTNHNFILLKVHMPIYLQYHYELRAICYIAICYMLYIELRMFTITLSTALHIQHYSYWYYTAYSIISITYNGHDKTQQNSVW